MIIFEIYNFNRKIEGVYVDVLDKKKTVKPFETASDLAQAIFNLNQDLMYKTTEVSFEKKKYTQLRDRTSWLNSEPSKFKDPESQAWKELIDSFDDWIGDIYKVTGVERKVTNK